MAKSVAVLAVDCATLLHNGVGCGWLLPLVREPSPELSIPLFLLDMEHYPVEFDCIKIFMCCCTTMKPDICHMKALSLLAFCPSVIKLLKKPPHPTSPYPTSHLLYLNCLFKVVGYVVGWGFFSFLQSDNRLISDDFVWFN